MLYFGSFNPVHRGHIALAEYVVGQGLCDEAVLVVSPQSPYKQAAELAPEMDRFEMAEIACAASKYPEHIKPSVVEFLLPKPSYTIDTLRYLKENFGSGMQFSILMGSDQIARLAGWKEYEQILEYPVYVYPRRGEPAEGFEGRITPLTDAPLQDFASTDEAALFAARGNKRVVSMVEFEKAKDKIMMGAERRSMVMTEAQKESTAYHEAGHAIIGRLVPEHDPVHKVTIIPRGRALGVTFFLPEGDAISASRQKLESQISTLYGGRLAEEIIYGPEHVSTGASNDIKVATNLARNMVTQWGFSDKLGPLLYAEEEGEVFLGRSVAKAKHMSDETARIIDQEVKSLIERNYGRARQLLNDNMDILHAMKDALMKYETIDAPQIDDLMARRDVRPPAGWEEPGSSNNSDNNGTPRAPRPVDEPRTPNPGNTMSEQLGDK